MKKAIVFQALPKWDGNYNSTALTISKLLAEDRIVFYVEHPFSYLDVFRKRNKEQITKRAGKKFDTPFDEHPRFVVIHPPMTLPLNKLQEGPVYEFLKKRYIRKLWKRIDCVLESFGIKEFGYVNSFDPVYFNFKSKHTCIYKIYHSVDLISGEPYIARHGVKAEEKASESADYVITTSLPLQKRLRQFNTGAQCIPNAVDFEHFSTPQGIPEEFTHSDRPKLIYTGNIGLRLDYEILESIADSFPEVDLYMVGPKDPEYFAGQKLEQKANVYFIGARAFSILPAYIQLADACIIPFQCTELTHHIYPLKLNEYLSAGKPVITSAFTDFGEFESVLHIYQNQKEAIQKTKEALFNSAKENRVKGRQLASQNTWNHRIVEWKKVLDQAESKRSSKDGTFHPTD